MREYREGKERKEDEKVQQKDCAKQNWEVEKGERRERREVEEMRREIERCNSTPKSSKKAGQEKQLMSLDYEKRSQALAKKLKNDKLNKKPVKARVNVRRVHPDDGDVVALDVLKEMAEEARELEVEIPSERRDPGVRSWVGDWDQNPHGERFDIRSEIAKERNKGRKACVEHAEVDGRSSTRVAACEFTRSFLSTLAQEEEDELDAPDTSLIHNGSRFIQDLDLIPENTNAQLTHYCDERGLAELAMGARGLGQEEREEIRIAKTPGFKRMHGDGLLAMPNGKFDVVRGKWVPGNSRMVKEGKKKLGGGGNCDPFTTWLPGEKVRIKGKPRD